jgi:hypothetical protein
MLGGRQSSSSSPSSGPQNSQSLWAEVQAQRDASVKLSIKSLSPDEIESYIKENTEIDLKGLWGVLNIKKVLISRRGAGTGMACANQRG